MGDGEWFARFAGETASQSPIYEAWALGAAEDDELLALVGELPRPRRQPNLIFAVSRLLGAPVGPYLPWRDWVVAHWPAVRAAAETHVTQTNEPGRIAAILPALARIPGPIALVDVGASAGLLLYPDRYSYDYSGTRLDPADGPSAVLLACETATPPAAVPTIVWRAGLDLNPLDVTSPDDVTWLETLIQPERTDRVARIRAAIDIARTDPPLLVAGDAVDALPALAAQTPRDARLVIMTAGTLVYLSRDDRARFAHAVSALDATWIALEGPGVVTDKVPPRPGLFALTVEGELTAWVGPLGTEYNAV